MDTFVLVLFAAGPLLQLALVTTSPSLPYASQSIIESTHSILFTHPKIKIVLRCRQHKLPFYYVTFRVYRRVKSVANEHYWTINFNCICQNENLHALHNNTIRERNKKLCGSSPFPKHNVRRYERRQRTAETNVCAEPMLRWQNNIRYNCVDEHRRAN